MTESRQEGSMTVDETRAAKTDLELKIMEQLAQFTKETGCAIERINLTPVETIRNGVSRYVVDLTVYI